MSSVDMKSPLASVNAESTSAAASSDAPAGNNDFRTVKPILRLRSACDACHAVKTKCTGGPVCMNCQTSGMSCNYSWSTRRGRPKGSKNRAVRQTKGPSSGGDRRREGPQSGATVQNLNLLTSALNMEDLVLANQTLEEHDTEDRLRDMLKTTVKSSLDSTILFPHSQSEHILSLPTQSSYGVQVDQLSSLSTAGNNSYASHDLDDPLSDPCATSDFQDTQIALSATPCTCLHQQSQLIFQLSNPQDHLSSLFTVDRVFRNVELAQERWSNLTLCPCKEYDHGKEVLLLFASSIRMILSSMQSVQLNHQQLTLRALGDTDTPTGNDIKISVGNFELKGEFKTEILSYMMKKALYSVSSALMYLQSYTGAFNHGLEPGQDDNLSEDSLRRLSEVATELLQSLQSDEFCLSEAMIEESAASVNFLNLLA